MDNLETFRGNKTFLHPVYPCPIYFFDREFPSAFHAFISANLKYKSDVGIMVKLDTIEAKKFVDDQVKMGRGYENFAQQKYTFMSIIQERKFGLHPPIVTPNIDLSKKLGEKLKEFDPALLSYHNTSCDVYWGKCFCGRHNGFGEDKLGEILRNVRCDILAGKNIVRMGEGWKSPINPSQAQIGFKVPFGIGSRPRASTIDLCPDGRVATGYITYMEDEDEKNKFYFCKECKETIRTECYEKCVKGIVVSTTKIETHTDQKFEIGRIVGEKITSSSSVSPE